MILVTNDDGIFAPGLWTLAKELAEVDKVVIVAPDRERSAIGTALTLRRPLRLRKAHSILNGVEAYAVDGTPGDSVILAADKLFRSQINLVFSGINEGSNLGDDVIISGTVGAALQGYLRNLPSVAISNAATDEVSIKTTARLGALIARRIKLGALPGDIFLNINVPGIPLSKITGISVARPAHKSHLDSAEEGSDGRHNYYWLVRRNVTAEAPEDTDVSAVSRGQISLTHLHTALFDRPAPIIGEFFCQNLLAELKGQPPAH